MPFLKEPEQRTQHVYIQPSDMQEHVYNDPNIIYVPEIKDTLDGNGRQYILGKMADRFASIIEKSEDDKGTNLEKFVIRSQAAAKVAIDNELFEVINTYLFEKANKLRGIFRNDSAYKYSDESELFLNDLQTARKQGGHQLSMARVDSLAEAIGSSACLVQVLNGKYSYQPIVRDRIRVVFADNLIAENGDLKPVNKMDIDDASAVIVQSSDAGYNKKASFVAYFTNSAKYPLGRQVKYSAENWYDIPDFGDEGAFDDEENGEPVNWMTIASQTWYDWKGPQIPIVLWYNDSTGYGSTLMPITPDFYKQCKELNLDNSRAMMSGLKSARGIVAYIKDRTGSNVLPEVMDEGPVVLEGGTLDAKSIPGANSIAAAQLIQDSIINTGGARGIPSHYLQIGNQTQFPSGAALRMASIPLVEARQERVTYNRHNMSRKFDIEKSLASLTNSQEVGTDVTEVWIPEVEITINTAQEIRDQMEFELKNKLTDLESAYMLLNNIESREEAENKLAELKSLPEAPKTGIFGNR